MAFDFMTCYGLFARPITQDKISANIGKSLNPQPQKARNLR
jgi:hypothetical protein